MGLLMCICGFVWSLPGWLAAWNQPGTSHSVWCRVCTQEQTVESRSGWLSQGLYLQFPSRYTVFSFPLSSILWFIFLDYFQFCWRCAVCYTYWFRKGQELLEQSDEWDAIVWNCLICPRQVILDGNTLHECCFSEKFGVLILVMMVLMKEAS